MKHVLFVDDDDYTRNALQRTLRPMRDRWDMQFVGSAEAALAWVDANPLDVFVSEVQLHGTDGTTLLGEVKCRRPEAVRVILSGSIDGDVILRSVGLAHQFLAKPCELDLLRSTVDRACVLQDRLNSHKLKRLAARVGFLPSLPSLYCEVETEIASPSGSVEGVGRIISRDIAMTAKVLQIVNSAFFGVRQEICDPGLAARFLGLRTIRSLVLTAGVFERLAPKGDHDSTIASVWERSLRVGTFARAIARKLLPDKHAVEQAFLGGTLHEIGTLVLLSADPARYAAALHAAHLAGAPDSEAAEQEAFGGTHSDLGAYLLGIWGLPNPVVEAVAFHHRPSTLFTAVMSPLTCVHIASAFASDGGCQSAALDHAYLDGLALAPRLPELLDVCMQESEAAST